MPEWMNKRPLAWMAIVGALIFALSFIPGLAGSGEGSPDEESWAPAVSRADAIAAAQQFVAGRSDDRGAWRDVDVIYQSDKELNGYLQKNGLANEYDRSYGDKLPTDYWEVRGTSAATGTAYTVRVGMDKPVIAGWQATVNGAKKGTKDEQAVAREELARSGYNEADFVYRGVPVSNGSRQTFESVKPVIGEARLTVTVGVVSDRVVSFTAKANVPQSYTDWFATQKRWASIMSGLFLLGWAALAITALVYTVLLGKELSFRRGILLTLLFAATNVLQIYNGLPGVLNDTDIAGAGSDAVAGNESFFSAFYIGFSLVIMALMAASVYLCLHAGDGLWRRRGWNAWQRWREPGFGKHVIASVNNGYLLCFFVFGAQQLIFWIAERSFDSFSIPDPMQSSLNAKWPALFPLLAWMAATSEEVLFRMFGIAIFKKLLRFDFLAVLVPSVIWAMGHTTYTIYPSYTRLIEVTIIGIIWGYAFLRFGLIAVIFSHAAFDSISASLSVAIEHGTPLYYGLAVVYAILPAAAGYAIAKLHSRRYPGGIAKAA